MEWEFAEAKRRFSQLMSKALSEGPQRVRCHKDTVVILAERDFEKLSGKRASFKEFLLGPGPSFEDLDLTRDKSPMRDIQRRESAK
jgi:hypothetical protein